MTQYNRPSEEVFASGAKPGEVENFPNIARGWGVAFDQTAGIPPMEWFNALFQRTDEALRYLMQRGVPEWSSTEDYPIGAYVQDGGKTWKAKVANINKKPSTNPASWVEWGLTKDDLNAAYAAANHSHSFAALTGKPTTLAGYGVTDALTADAVAWPLSALPFPVISTADNRLGVTAQAIADGGGRVTIQKGVTLSLGQRLGNTETGRLRIFTSPDWTSPVLDTSSIYFLRAQVSAAGDLVVYMQKGTDGDLPNSTLRGVPGGNSGGGFDSTVLDMLIARVVSGGVGSLPVVTPLANAATLKASTSIVGEYDIAPNTDYFSFTYNWARTPEAYVPVFNAESGNDYEQMAGIKFKAVTRYGLQHFGVAYRGSPPSSIYCPSYVVSVRV